MKCWKCGKEMVCMCDSSWRKHKDGEITRTGDYICAECRVFVTFSASDYSECDLEDE